MGDPAQVWLPGAVERQVAWELKHRTGGAKAVSLAHSLTAAL